MAGHLPQTALALFWCFFVIIGVNKAQAQSPAGRQTRDYFVTSVTLFSQDILQGLELSASVYNLFDRTYSDQAGPENE